MLGSVPGIRLCHQLLQTLLLLEGFVEAWYEAFGSAEVTAADLMKVAEENEVFGFVFAKKTPQARGAVFGKLLRRYIDAPSLRWFIRQRKARQAFYRLEAIG